MAPKKSTTPDTPSVADVAAAFRLIADWIELAGDYTTSTSAPAKSGKSTSSSAAEVDVLDEDEIRALPIKELRELAIELGLDEQKMKNGILAELEAKGHFGDAEDADDEDAEDEADEEDEDEEDEEEGYDREELEEMSLAELKKLAKEEKIPAAQIRGADQDALIDLILGEDEDEADEEDDEDAEEEEIDEDALKEMSLTEVKKVAADLGLKISPRIAKNKAKIVEFILENAGEEDDE